MSDIDKARETFVAALESKGGAKGGTSVDAIFDKGLAMAEAGETKEAIKQYLHDAVTPSGDAVRGDAGACADQCRDQCKEYPDGPPWYACYAGCFAGCMSA